MTTTMHLPNVCEYSQVTPDNQSRKTRVLTGYGRVGYSTARREYTLSHHTAGYELAGSMARYTNEKWTVRFHSDNAFHSRSFLGLARAKAYFYKCTGSKSKGGAS